MKQDINYDVNLLFLSFLPYRVTYEAARRSMNATGNSRLIHPFTKNTSKRLTGAGSFFLLRTDYESVETVAALCFAFCFFGRGLILWKVSVHLYVYI